jgi:hypothetical protein
MRGNSMKSVLIGLLFLLVSAPALADSSTRGGTLLSAATTSAAGPALESPSGTYEWVVRGTWGGATAQLQFSDDNSTWIDIEGATMTANGGGIFEIAPAFIRVNLTGATGSTNLNSVLLGVAK